MRIRIIMIVAVLWTAGVSAQPKNFNYDETTIAPYTLPDPLLKQNGKRVRNVRQWEKSARGELLSLFETEMFGKAPGRPEEMHFRILSEDDSAFGGLATRKEVGVCLTASDSVCINVLVYVPNNREKPAPAFMAMNFKGNHATCTDTCIPLPTRQQIEYYGPKYKEAVRGENSRKWPFEYILSQGYAVVTFFRGDVDPDYHDGFRNGLHGILDGDSPRKADSWGTVAAWSLGLSCVMDYLEQDEDIDEDKVAVVGHSRLGKAALWAGATDPRFALVIANNSGCSGAKISRRTIGETVARLNRTFPHWFCENYKKYGNDEAALPFDQHQLIALIAPRPVYVASASADLWADPKGEMLGLVNASPVYELYGYSGLDMKDLPPVNSPVSSDRMGYHLREGRHDILRYDWEQYIAFADRFFK